ncbi:MAG: hypothetical protein ACREPS_11555, partial [Rhodanobacteraceae bacterium]
MANGGRRKRAENRWRIAGTQRARAVWVEPGANDQLRRVATVGDGTIWQSIGRHPCFGLDRPLLGAPLAAGWYELCGRLEVEEGSIVLPSVSLHYAVHSALSDVEIMLPEPDASGRIGTLLLFLEDVESLEFVPGICPARFRMQGFSLRRVTRLKALYMMLGSPVHAGGPGRIERSLAWARTVRHRGLKRATNRLYADYRGYMWPKGVCEYEAWVRKYDTLDPASLDDFRQRARVLGGRGPLISLLL